MFSSIVSILFVFSLNSCSIEGEDVCGIWNAKGHYGEMKLEITPWKGKFHAYLLEHKTTAGTIKGGKEEEFIFLTDLVFKDTVYQNGKIYLGQNSEQSCAISLRLIDANQLRVIYNCDGALSEEVWTRDGFIPSKTEKKVIQTEKGLNVDEKENNIPISKPSMNADSNEGISTAIKNGTENRSVKKQEATYTEQEGETKPQATFYVIGIHKALAYDDMNMLSKAVESLWNKIYNEDFSGKLKNIVDQQSMYVVYSEYDNPKGKMTITIGYKVKNLSKIPSGLKGVKVPSNDYYVYPLSGETTDYEGEGWKQMEGLVAYRERDSADFEVYTLDKNYEVTKAEMWIAAK